MTAHADQRLSGAHQLRRASITISPTWCNIRHGTRATFAWIIRHHPKTTSLHDAPFRTRRHTFPARFPPVALPGLSKPINLGDEGSFAGTSFQPAQHAVFSYVRVISPRLVNEFRVGFNRFRAGLHGRSV